MSKSKKEEHPPYTTVYKSICGWQSVLVTWDKEIGYEAENTGMGPYGDSSEGYNMAVDEAKAWAESEGIEYKELSN